MNKAELVEAISTEAKLTKADAGRALEAFVTATTKVAKFKAGADLAKTVNK